VRLISSGQNRIVKVNARGIARGLSFRMDAKEAHVPLNPVAPLAAPRRSGGFVDPRRVFDVTVTLVVLPFALIIGTITALAIFLDSPGPVFYSSTRVGSGGRAFRMLKFRKFRNTATGGALTVAGDERFTPIGRFLAVTKLDELPQLWNVLRGDMRLVGPRPEVVEFVDCYPEHYERILQVVPGITGPAALEYADESYLLGEQEDPHTFYRAEVLPRKIAIDIAYVDQHSVRGDVRILMRTFIVPARQFLRRLRFVSHHDDAAHHHLHHHHRRLGIRLIPLAFVGALLIASFAFVSSSQL
jgi:lipopolysaccharide/colanic/teichoic acid biosynthesis glycosyltransferase